MGERRPNTEKVKLFFGLLARDQASLDAAAERLAKDFSPVDLRSETIPFGHTDYYAAEMGANLLRQWVSTTDAIHMPELADIKIHTNRLEGLFAEGIHRRVNMDPGYLSHSKVVLATTKDHAHRLYVGSGIYEEVTLHYHRPGAYEPWPWTYPDYRTETARWFFLGLRELLHQQTRSASQACHD
jgi:hypothetical protein